jgi:hypothetical protein
MSLTAQVRSVRQFCEHVRKVAEGGDLAEALDLIGSFVRNINEREAAWGTVFSSPDLDLLCMDLGRFLPSWPVRPIDPDRAVFLVTALYPLGGHTRVLMDLIRADPGRKVTVLMTNMYHQLAPEEINGLLANLKCEIELAPAGNLAGTLAWLQRRLAELSPARTYILQHQFDSVIVAASQPETVGRLFYYHNCDVNLALGVHIPHAVHVDFNSKLFHHCRCAKGVTGNVYWPLVADVGQHRCNRPFLASGRLTTATSGGLPKFDMSFLREQTPYLYSYLSVLPLILRATGGTHIHIGPLMPDMLVELRDRLERAGITPDCFVHIPWVQDVAAELVEREVDLYIGSFPLGGGRATVEVMGAGMPLLLHANYASVFFTDVGEVYPGVMVWRHPEEITEILSNLTACELAAHGRRAREHYEAHHTPGHLKNAIKATLSDRPWPPPPPLAYQPDLLQRHLDLLAAAPRPQVALTLPEVVLQIEQTLPEILPTPVRSIPNTIELATEAARDIHTKHLAAIVLRRVAYKGQSLLTGRR